jgi:iron complex outermembrane recepter protein
MRTCHLAISSASPALAAALLVATPALAQQAGTTSEASQDHSGGLSEIVVTATRQASNVQQVPLAITAIGGDALRSGGVANPRDLSSLAPNLLVDQGYSNGSTHASIRGIASTDYGVGSLSPVATYIDDIYQVYQYGLGTQVFDMNRIEVLRGPQGTLFGKNTTGGALAYYSKAPSDKQEGYFESSVGGGDFGEYTAEGAFNTPVTDNLAMRFSGRFDHRDAYINNLENGSKLGKYTNFSGRAQFAWTPSADTHVLLKIYGVINRGDGPVYIGQINNALGCNAASGLNVYNACSNGVPTVQSSVDSHNTYSNNPSREDYDNYGATLKVEHNFGDYVLTSITGLQQGHYGITTNDTGTTGDFFHSQQSSFTQQASEELRIATPAHAKLHGIFGLFAGYDKIRADQNSGSTTLQLYNPTGYEEGYEYTGGSLVTQKTTSFAVFGSLTYDVTDKLSVIGGARYSWERRVNNYQDDLLQGVNADGTIRAYQQSDLFFLNGLRFYQPGTGDVYEQGRASAIFQRVTWDATANYKFSRDAMIYGKVGSGFRSGYFPTFITTPGTFTEVHPEDVTSFEVGFKTEWFDRKLRLNGDVYYMNYRNMQVQIPYPFGPGLIIGNAASAHLRGIELDGEVVPFRNLHLTGSAGYSDATYLKYTSTDAYGNVSDLSGNRLPYAPEWTAGFGGYYDFNLTGDLKLQYRTNWSYRSKIFFDPYNTDAVSAPQVLTGNMSLSLESRSTRWKVTLFSNNITNRLIKGFAYNQTYVVPTIYAPMRTFGLRASIDF